MVEYLEGENRALRRSAHWSLERVTSLGLPADGARWRAATLGALVSEAVATDLGLTVSAAVSGRGATMTRMVPAVYAAPVFFHYITYFSLLRTSCGRSSMRARLRASVSC